MKRIFGCLGFWILFCATDSQAITVTLDYTLDQAAFFANHLDAQATVEQAASDLSEALTSGASATLNAVDTDIFTGSDPALTLVSSFDWRLEVADPANPDPLNPPLTLDSFTLRADRFTVFVGAATALSSLDALGEGAPVSGAADLNYLDDPASEAAIASSAAYSNGILLRGAGPTITSISDSVMLTSGHMVNYTLKLGALASFLTFDTTKTWNYRMSAPGAGEFDFYTVMLHEMIHGLGFGTSETWRAMVTNGNKDWTGPHAVTENGGSGANLINDMLGGKPDGSHILNGTMSKTLDDDTNQEAVMTASLTAGVRRKLTKLDLAFLKDLGYGPAIAAPTPPPTPTTPQGQESIPTPPLPPGKPTLTGPPKFTTTTAKTKLKGVLLADGAYVEYKVGSGSYVKAKGGRTWMINLNLKPGKNIVTIVAYDPVSKLMSSPKKVTITLKKKKN